MNKNILVKKEKPFCQLKKLPGVKKYKVDAYWINDTSDIEPTLELGYACTSSGNNGAINIWKDDTDENQWFVTDSPLSVSYDDAVGNDHYFTEPKGSVFFWDINWMHATIISGNYHKATVEELMEHFKDKEE